MNDFEHIGTSIEAYNLYEDLGSVSQRFIEGLELYNLTVKEINDSGWKYCGGDKSQRHINYFSMVWPGKRLPPHQSHCICGHYIVENCYITDMKYMITLGNCCIKRFVKNSGRTCDECGEVHKNRIQNKCNKCKTN